MRSPLDICAPGTTVAERHFGPITPEDLRRYAAASGDSNPLHLEPEFARQAGFDDVIVHGMLAMALLGRLVTENFARSRLITLAARFRHVIRAGESIHCRARLEAPVDDTCILALEALSPAGTLLIEATATLSFEKEADQ